MGANMIRIVRLIKSYFDKIEQEKKAIALAKQAKYIA
jgi:hypothetical protein